MRDADETGDWTWQQPPYSSARLPVHLEPDVTRCSRTAGHANYRIMLDMYVGSTGWCPRPRRQATENRARPTTKGWADRRVRDLRHHLLSSVKNSQIRTVAVLHGATYGPAVLDDDRQVVRGCDAVGVMPSRVAKRPIKIKNEKRTNRT